MGKISELSVFLPTYNEEKNITSVVAGVLAVLSAVADRYELVIVNDGSTDRTSEAVERLVQNDNHVRCIHHKNNRGYGAALSSGLYACRYEWISFIDADGQFDFSEIARFITIQRETEADLVVGYYLSRAVPIYRKLNSFLWQTLIFLFFGLRVRDIDCGFKLIRRKVVEAIPKLESERGAFISTEFLVKAKRAGFRIVEVGVHHYPRRSGSATGANLNVIIKSFVDLLRLRRRLR